MLIGGWSPGSGRRTGTIGSLLVGVSTPDGLAYIGNVGTGFTDAVLRDLLGRLTALEIPTSPFNAVPVPREFARVARWVRPELSGEVAYAEIGLEGRLRHPRWRGLRQQLTGRAPGQAAPAWKPRSGLMGGGQGHRPQAETLQLVGGIGVVLDLGGAGDGLQDAAGGAVGAADEVVQDGGLLLVGEPHCAATY